MRVARKGHEMQQFTNQDIADIKSRIDQIQEMLNGRGDEAAAPDEGRAPATLTDQITFGIQMRRVRRSHFGEAHMSGPSWDMMLDLMLARMRGRQKNPEK